MSKLYEILQSLWDEVPAALTSYRKEAAELRDSQGEPSVDEKPGQLHSRLVGSRRAQDRLEYLLGEIGLVKSRCKMAVAECQAAYDDQWRTVMQSTRIGEYSSAQERNATYQAGSVEQLINLRKAQRLLDEVNEVFEYVLLKFRGLDSSRRDVESRIRLLNVQGYLEN